MESLSDHFESSEQTFSGSNEHVQKTVDARSVAKHIKKDPLAFDFLLCLVSSAAKTYRRETTLKPVPKLNQEPMDVAKAFQLVDGLPSLTTIMLDPDCLNQVQVKPQIFHHKSKKWLKGIFFFSSANMFSCLEYLNIFFSLWVSQYLY